MNLLELWIDEIDDFSWIWIDPVESTDETMS